MWVLPVIVIAVLGSLWFVGYYLPTGKHMTNSPSPFSRRPLPNDFLPECSCEKNRMFTEHEKVCYRALCSIASEYGYTVFAKVPLCFLVSPRPRVANYNSVLGRLGITYADFVLCDSYLKASLVVTLELSNIEVAEGTVRDLWSDSVLRHCGVDVLHTAAIDSNTRVWIVSHCKQS